MEAVFACMGGSYRQLGYWDVNGVILTYSKGNGEELGAYRASRIVGQDVDYKGLEQERVRFYHFYEGERHNQLTLTDPREILNMRKWLQRRGNAQGQEEYIEVSCDEEAEKLTEADLVKEEPVEVKQEEPVKKRTEDYDDWDIRLSGMMRKR